MSTKKRLTPLIFLCWLGGGWLVSHVSGSVEKGWIRMIGYRNATLYRSTLSGVLFPSAEWLDHEVTAGAVTCSDLKVSGLTYRQ